jgi:hypothetical protein
MKHTNIPFLHSIKFPNKAASEATSIGHAIATYFQGDHRILEAFKVALQESKYAEEVLTVQTMLDRARTTHIAIGTPSPWGYVQWKRELAPGVVEVSTAAHGGILVEKERAKKLLSEKAIEIGSPWGNFLTYEEDCERAAVIYEHPEWYGAEKAKDVKKDAEAILRQFYPAYFQTDQKKTK